jgi:hypothetical protein
MTGPDLTIELAAITLMKAGTVSGGLQLLPGSLSHVPPHDGGFGFNTLAKPLKLAGAEPPLRWFAFDHWAPQKVIFVPTTASRSPITKLPA